MATGTDSGVIAGIDAAIQLKTNYNIRVINLSLGRPVYESYAFDPLCQAVEAAWKAGIVVVAAAGNMGRDNTFQENGYGTILAPGNDPYVITVGAMKTMGAANRSADLMASYSSNGPTSIDHIVKPDLVAPGNQEVSLLASTAQIQQQYPQVLLPSSAYMSPAPGNTSNDYIVLSGTSMATPSIRPPASATSPTTTFSREVRAILIPTLPCTVRLRCLWATLGARRRRKPCSKAPPATPIWSFRIPLCGARPPSGALPRCGTPPPYGERRQSGEPPLSGGPLRFWGTSGPTTESTPVLIYGEP